ncbi:enoyl-CoA hydratase [Alicyclobacillus tolerans]|uniref:enoyl-CoA hydratase/isomerase family protein n=1 Tax=Alicyclobacillus tolerans TaxID=90970 RepID=UPI001F4055AA|nr:enoyl-CoA hydratase [Alicyclobacillus tolerans]MCF8565236.1 enoyl-CoA hydratase [Alicyclobacillus tolerans]
MEHKDILSHVEDHVLHLTLNRPDSLNAFSPDMMDGLLEGVQLAKSSPDIRAILLTGAGRAFSAGGDVKSMGVPSPARVYDHIGHFNEVILAMAKVEVPIVAAVHGWAAGAGVNLALASDIIYAAQDSKFVLSFSKIGLISDGGGLFFLPRTIGLYRAKEVLFNAEPFTAEQAMQWGMVNRTFPADQLMDEAKNYAKKLAAGPTRSVSMIKTIANRALVSDLAAVLEMERTSQTVTQSSADHKEGVQAFVEKRPPKFTGQ